MITWPGITLTLQKVATEDHMELLLDMILHPIMAELLIIYLDTSTSYLEDFKWCNTLVNDSQA